MGAWGYGSFENDDALDWVGDLQESTDTSAIVEALNSVTDDAEDYIEASECSMAIAASEVVAALNGNGTSSSLPEEVTDWLAGKAVPDWQLLANAQKAVDAVLSASELKELWEESEDYPKWKKTLEDLKSRLS